MSKKTLLALLVASHLLVATLVLVFSPWLSDSLPLRWVREQLTGQHQLAPVADPEGEILYWTCSMHPSVRMPEPGKCPICSMDLIPVKKSVSSPTPGAGPEAGNGPEDPSLFVVDAKRQQLINVQTTPVEIRPLIKRIRAYGTLTLDERLIEHVHPRVSGWLEETYVDFEHAHVMKGDPLFSIYSPELVASQEEYLLALRTAEDLSTSPFDHVSQGARSLVHAARRRLELFNLTDSQIRELEKTGQVKRTVTVYSPVTGHVIKRNAFPNQYVTPETAVYTIADHSRIWAQVEVYENDIPYLRVGRPVVMTIPSSPGERLRGRISYLYPHLNPKTRTMNVRLEFPNPDLRLKPEMYVDGEIEVALGEKLTVPDTAVLRTGTRDLVFVDLGEGRMQMREIQVGDKTGEYYPVLAGLQAGERVVTSANFLIDAEARIRGTEASWATPQPRSHH